MFGENKPWLSERIISMRKEKPVIKVQEKKQQKRALPAKNSMEILSHEAWDKIGLEEMVRCKHKALFVSKSKYQDIKVIEAKDIRMYLNDQLQFSSLDERIYHEAFVHIPMSLAKKHKRVLILGGGDGLALREVIKYNDVQHIDLVDLDEKVLYASKNVKEILSLNECAFSDRRAHVYAQDALEFIQNVKIRYDLIIIDFPDPENAVLAQLYTRETFEDIYHVLDEDGVLVCQSNCTDATPVVFWSIGRTMEAAGFYIDNYHTIIPSFGDWGFHIGAKKPINRETIKVTVPHRTLPKNPAILFQFTYACLRQKRFAQINSLNHLCLHDIFKKELTKEI